jgi:hypothetical protein
MALDLAQSLSVGFGRLRRGKAGKNYEGLGGDPAFLRPRSAPLRRDFGITSSSTWVGRPSCHGAHGHAELPLAAEDSSISIEGTLS